MLIIEGQGQTVVMGEPQPHPKRDMIVRFWQILSKNRDYLLVPRWVKEAYEDLLIRNQRFVDEAGIPRSYLFRGYHVVGSAVDCVYLMTKGKVRATAWPPDEITMENMQEMVRQLEGAET